MVTRALTLTGGGDTISLESEDFAALNGATGFGMVPVHNRWHDGAGHGSTFAGSRALRRPFTLPTLLRAPDADTLQDKFGRLSRILAPGAVARLALDQGPAGHWWCDVVRAGGGDPVWGEASNGSTWLLLDDLTLEAGDPRWTASVPVNPIELKPAGEGRGLLSGVREAGYGVGPYGAGGYGIGFPEPGPGWSLTQLRLMSGQALGPFTMHNPGDASGVLEVDVRGPATYVGLTSPTGEAVEWSGNLLEGQALRFDFAANTVTDGAGVSQYRLLAGAPVWWEVPPGETRGEVILTGATTASAVRLVWYPRRWVLVP